MVETQAGLLSLPVEILWFILENLIDDGPTLYSLLLSTSRLHGTVTSALYRSPKPAGFDAISLLADDLRSRPHLAAYVVSLHFMLEDRQAPIKVMTVQSSQLSSTVAPRNWGRLSIPTLHNCLEFTISPDYAIPAMRLSLSQLIRRMASFPQIRSLKIFNLRWLFKFKPTSFDAQSCILPSTLRQIYIHTVTGMSHEHFKLFWDIIPEQLEVLSFSIQRPSMRGIHCFRTHNSLTQLTFDIAQPDVFGALSVILPKLEHLSMVVGPDFGASCEVAFLKLERLHIKVYVNENDNVTNYTDYRKAGLTFLASAIERRMFPALRVLNFIITTNENVRPAASIVSGFSIVTSTSRLPEACESAGVVLKFCD